MPEQPDRLAHVRRRLEAIGGLEIDDLAWGAFKTIVGELERLGVPEQILPDFSRIELALQMLNEARRTEEKLAELAQGANPTTDGAEPQPNQGDPNHGPEN